MAAISAEPGSVVEFLGKVASDDAFRAALEKDPVGVLAQNGIVMSDMPSKISLPDKRMLSETLAQTLTTAKSGDMEVRAAHIVFLAFFAFMR
jgi:hypothetical protein